MTEKPSQVVSLNGEIIDHRKANADVVDVLKSLLEMAKSGEIVGIAAVAVCHDDGTWMRRAGLQNLAMLGRVEVMKARITEDLS